MQETMVAEADNDRRYTVAGMRESLNTRLWTMATCYNDAARAVSELERTIDMGCRLISEREALEKVFDDWVDEHLQATNESYRGCANGKIQKSELSEVYRSMAAVTPEVERELRMGNTNLDSAIEALLGAFDYAGMNVELHQLGAGLEDRGLREAANLIAGEFGLRNHWGYSSEHPPKVTKRYYEFSRPLFPDHWAGYSHSFKEEMVRLARAFEVAERDAGLLGVGYSMNTIAQAFMDTRFNQTFESRTVLNQGGAVEAVVFKSKLVFRLNHESGDGLLAFLRIHSHLDLEQLPAAR